MFEELLDDIEKKDKFMKELLEEQSIGNKLTVRQRAIRKMVQNGEADPGIEAEFDGKGGKSLASKFDQTFHYNRHKKMLALDLKPEKQEEAQTRVNEKQFYKDGSEAEQRLKEAAKIPSMLEKAPNCILMLNENVIFRYDIEFNFLKDFRLKDFMLFSFPTFLDCRNGCLMYSGGLRGGDDVNRYEPVPFVFLFNTRRNFMSQVQNMNTARYKHQLCVCRNKIYALGGLSLQKTICKSVECYDFEINKWQKCAPM